MCVHLEGLRLALKLLLFLAFPTGLSGMEILAKESRPIQTKPPA
jgi:hypothetical protein